MKKTHTKHIPTWNLSDLYSGVEDTAINQDLTKLKKKAEQFAKTYRGSLARKDIDAAKLHKALQEYESILVGVGKVEAFAFLEYSTASTDAKVGAFFQRMRAKCLEVYQPLTFFELELARLSKKKLEELAQSSSLAAYDKYLTKQAHWRPHRLSEAEEKLMNDKALTSRSAFTRLFEQETARKTFPVRAGKRTKEATLDDLLTNLHKPDRALRKKTAETLSKGLAEELPLKAYIFNTLIEDKAVDDRYRKFSSPEEARHLDNETTQAMVDAMVEAVTKSASVSHEYYRFKKRVLGLKDMHDYDRYAPVTARTKSFTFTEAKDIILEAFTSFSPAYAKAAQEFFDNGWIDAKPKPGKQGGAYCYYVTPDLHPYVFMNFNGAMNDVSTLAHELGHAIHAYLSRKQSYLSFDTPLTVAETASVFGEMLVFDHLKSQLKPKEVFALYMSKLDGIVATVYRQIGMYKFEKDVHAARKEGELSSEQFNAFWQKRMGEAYGPAVKLSPGHAMWWSYIPHVIRTPFYVYAYAFGELLTLALYEKYLENGSSMAEGYVEMLSKGGSEFPEKLVTPLGVDLTDPTFWHKGTEMIQHMLNQAEDLHKKL